MSDILTHQDAGVLTLTFNRVERKNSINVAMYDALATAIAQQNLGAIGWVILAMTLVILAYDQLLFRPLVAWADKFRMDNTSSGKAPQSWLLDLIRRTRLIHQLLVPLGRR